MNKFKSFCALFLSLLLINGAFAIDEVIEGNATVYGGFLYYSASGPRWIAPCNEAESAAMNAVMVECRRRGFRNLEMIGDAQLIDSGFLSRDILEHRPHIQNGKKMYCSMRVNVECL